MPVTKLFALVLLATINALSFGSPNSSSSDSLKIIEKVYLHTDRSTYYPGDDIWFKAYLIDASERLLSDHSSNLHVELISPTSDIIDSRILKIINGQSNGDFHLSDKLKSGEYCIRAYTNYMRNFGDDLFFHKNIIIINPTDSANLFTDKNTSIENKLDLSFFPEGGSLLENVTSTVAFKAEDANGLGCNVTGNIYSSAGELITSFKSVHNGMGTFLIRPSAGISYYALTKNTLGEEVKTDLPKAFSTGVCLSVNQFSLTFRTNNRTLPLIQDHDLSLNIYARGNSLMSYNFRMKSLNSYLNLPVDSLPEGIVMLTLREPDSTPLGERMIYIHKSGDVKINLNTAKAIYKQRDSVMVNISFSDSSRLGQAAFLSLSATGNIFTDNSSHFPSNISSWFLLESDIRGQVEDPLYYFDPANPNRLKDLDILLLTQGWRDFKWKYNNTYFPAENGFTITGRVRKKLADEPIKNSKVIIAVFKNGDPYIKSVPTDSIGKFNLSGIGFSGQARLIATSNNEKDQKKGWLIIDSLNYSPPKVQLGSGQKRQFKRETQSRKNLSDENQLILDSTSKNETLKTFIQYAEFRKSVIKKYRLSDTIKPGEVTITAVRRESSESVSARARRYLGKLWPDKVMTITPQMERYGTLGQLFEVKLNMLRFGHPGGSPAFLLDGNMVGYDDISILPVSMIERVDMLDALGGYGMYGEKGREGLISITTKEDWGSSPINLHSVNVRLCGYNEPRVFYSPKHHTTLLKDYKPDLRTTLFWEPNIKVENNKDYEVNYYNGDNSAKINVIVEGITSTGIPVTCKTEYEVK